MRIIDKHGYLKDALKYIERNIVACRTFQKLASKSGINEVVLRKLSSELQKFSEKYFFSCLEEELEERHSSLSGAGAEISGADISIDVHKDKAFVLISLRFNIVIDDETEDKTKIDIKIFSNKNIIIN